MRVALRAVALAVSTWLALASPASAEVHLSLHNGRVTLVAKDATVRQILAEWSRVGGTRIVNGERVPGGPLTLELKDVPEAEALDVLLRSLSGYIIAPRSSLASPDASVYESIAVMPTIASNAPRTASASPAPAPFAPQPSFNANEDDQDNAPVRPVGVAPQPVRPPIFSTFPSPQQGNVQNPGGARPMLPVVRPGIIPQPQVNNPGEGQPPIALPPPSAPASGQPGAPAGVSAPGMIAPAPASQPGQPTPPQRQPD